MDKQAKAISMILRKRASQDAQWGGNSHIHMVWMAILMEELGKLSRSWIRNDGQGVEDYLVSAAAVMLAWLEDYLNGGTRG